MNRLSQSVTHRSRWAALGATLAVMAGAGGLLTALGVGAWSATQLRLDDNGNGWSDGNTVRYEAAVGLTATTFIDTPVAPVGMVQFPLVPHTGVAIASVGARGVERVPTRFAARVSSSRHGVIGTNDDAPVEPDADAVSNPPAPAITASVAPKAAHRDRCVTN